MNRLSSRGFSLVELAIVLVVFGIALAIGVPMLSGLSSAQQLKGATENMAAQLRLAREIAIDTSSPQCMHLFYATLGGDYHIHNGAIQGGTWSLPRGITYNWATGTSSVFNFATDGRADVSALVILQNTRGEFDTISVQTSGLILTK
jgi:prepilin-type N-terminal cleavage/methylation domain-containing protein